MNKLLERVFRASRDLTHTLETDYPLNDVDRLKLENHLAVLHHEYAKWKQRNGPSAYYLSSTLSEDWL